MVWLKKICGLSLVLMLSASIASGATSIEKFSLRPPKIEVKPICTAKESIETLRKRWETFDPAALRGLKTDQLRAIVQRLISYDANASFEVAEKLLRHLMTKKDRITSAQFGSDLVKLYIEANRLNSDNAKELLPLIERGPLAGSPNNLYLSGLIYEQGQAVRRDLEIAYRRFFAAAQAGNPEALLKLIKLKQAGIPQAKNIDVTMTMTMAISALLADRTPVICARLKNIARLFSKGDYIEQDHEAAAEWLRLAADFGDIEAAWNLARMHLRSEIIVKDNAVLVKYMGQAAEGGVVPAMIELATVYLDGSLVDADAAKAEYWYIKAGETGSVPALVRLVELYERQGTGVAEEKIEAVLRRITARPEAPAQALVALAKIELRNKGNVAGLAVARPLLERAAELGDPEAQLAVAGLGIAGIVDRPSFRRVANQMEVAAAAGNSDAMLALSWLHMCHNPSGPDIPNATAWRERALGAGNKRVELEQLIAAGPADSESPSQIAPLRSNALSGSSDSLAYLIDAYGNSPVKMGGNEAAAFWRARLALDAGAMWRYAKLIARRSNPTQSRKLLEDAVAAGSVTAKIDLARLLIDSAGSSDPEVSQMAYNLLVEAAMKGRGESLEILLERKGSQWLQLQLNRGGLRKAIADRGDYRAFIVAARLSESIAERKSLLVNAGVLVDCNFDGALKMAKAYSGLGETTDVMRWASIAGALTGAGGANAFRLADFYQKIGPQAFASQINELYSRAAKTGHSGALLRLLSSSADRNSPDFDRKKAIKLAESAKDSNDPKVLYMAARALAAVGDESPEYIGDSLGLLRQASELGYPPAMRDYGIALLRGKGSGRTSMNTGIELLTQAADQGDAKAMVELARSFAMGIGVEVSKKKAEELLRGARALGNEEAAALLLSLAEL